MAQKFGLLRPLSLWTSNKSYHQWGDSLHLLPPIYSTTWCNASVFLDLVSKDIEAEWNWNDECFAESWYWTTPTVHSTRRYFILHSQVWRDCVMLRVTIKKWTFQEAPLLQQKTSRLWCVIVIWTIIFTIEQSCFYLNYDITKQKKILRESAWCLQTAAAATTNHEWLVHLNNNCISVIGITSSDITLHLKETSSFVIDYRCNCCNNHDFKQTGRC